jgi:sigma-E factor negative regulatory protein RseC
VLEEIVTVQAVEGETVWVEAQPRSSCGSCGSSAHCGTGVLARLLGSRRNRLAVGSDLAVVPGEHVVIGIPDGLLVQASAVAYLAPLLSMALPAVFCDAMGLDDAYVAGVALLGLALGLLVMGRVSCRFFGRYRPRILRRQQFDLSIPNLSPGAHP